MSRTKQNIILLQEPSIEAYDISLQAGNMCLNRFCIDEEAGFELSGVYSLKKHKLQSFHEFEKSDYKQNFLNLGKDSKFSSNFFSRCHRES